MLRSVRMSAGGAMSRRRTHPRMATAAAARFPAFFLFLLLRAGGAGGARGAISSTATSAAAVAVAAAASVERLVEQRFAMEPQDQTAIVGSRVTLPCRVIGRSGQLQWTKDDFGLGTHRNLSGFERYQMVGSDEEGDFSLDISPVMLDDDAKYQCQVGPGRGGTPGIRSRFAKLTVLVPPEAPKIVQGDFMVTTEGREVELECVSVGGKPAAEITWIDGLGTVLSKGIEYVKEPLRDARRYTAKSILKLTPKKEHHNTSFTCQAQNTADRTYRSARLKLEVKYAPKVRVAAVGGALAGGRIPEGAEVRLACHADANPQDLTYRWLVGDEPSESGHAQDLVLGNVSRQLHGTIVRCEVRNAVGRSEATATLDISYGPSFRARPTPVEADPGTSVTLSCSVDGNPAPDILWIHEPADRIVSSAPNLTLTASAATAGRYLCRASVPGFPTIEADATLHLRGPPAISSPRQQFGALHGRAQLECVAHSVPRPRHVLWSFNGRELNVSGPTSDDDTDNDGDDDGGGGAEDGSSEVGEFRALQTPIPNGIRATLVLGHCRREHFGRYNCTVVNDYGVDFLEIDFISKEPNLLPALVLGSLGVITLLIVLVVIGLCVCSRRNRKKHLPPADVIPKYDVPGKEGGCPEGSVGAHNGSRKIDRTDELLEAEGTTNIALSVRTTGSSGALQTTPAGIGSPLTALKGEATTDYSRYSGDFSDSLSHLQHQQHQQQQQQQQKPSPASGGNNNGYVPYASYARDYSPPTQHLMQFKASSSSGSLGKSGHPPGLAGVGSGPQPTATMTMGRAANGGGTMTLARKRPDPAGLPSIQSSVSSIPNGLLNHPILGCHIGLDARFGTNYGTLHGRGTASPMPPLPLPVPLPPPATANPAATPAPPPYNAARASACLLGLGAASLQQAGAGLTSTLANPAPCPAATAGSSSPGSTQSGSLSLASSQLSQGQATTSSQATTTVGGPIQPSNQQQQQQQQPSSPSGQFILPSSGTVKPGVLATHV